MLKFKTKKKARFPIASLLIWIVTLIAIILAKYYNEHFDVNQYYSINPSLIADNIQKSWWHILRLISALFLHGSFQHWAGNMLLFLIIALPLEKRVGSFWFILIYFVSGFIANVTCLYQLGDSVKLLLGASGAVSGLLGAWIMLNPKQNISIIIPIGFYLQKAKIPIILIAIVWLSLQIILQFNSVNNYPIVWVTHIVGFIAGFFMAWLYRLAS